MPSISTPVYYRIFLREGLITISELQKISFADFAVLFEVHFSKIINDKLMEQINRLTTDLPSGYYKENAGLQQEVFEEMEEYYG